MELKKDFCKAIFNGQLIRRTHVEQQCLFPVTALVHLIVLSLNFNLN